MAKQSRFLTTRETSELLGVALTTVQLWVESGALPAWKTAGGHRRIPRNAVEALLAEQSASVEGVGRPSQCTVLIVEDDPVARELYRLRFTDWQLPIKLLLAENGFDGLLLAGRYTPDLIISDLSMPGMDGVKMIHYLLQKKDTPILIVVTALTSAEIESKGGLPPDIPVYPKPVSFTALRVVVDYHVQRKARIQQRQDK